MDLIGKLKSGKLYPYLSELLRDPQMLLFKRRFRRLDDQALILLGTPAHKNLGDHLIAVSERRFIRTCYPDKPLLEIPTHVFVRYQDYIAKHATGKNTVFITGGGWMGSVWPDDELTLQSMLRAFHASRLVILPQTMYYDRTSEAGEALFQSADSVFSACRDLKVCVRDQRSYDAALTFKNLSPDRLLLCPDIALYDALDPAYKSGQADRVGVYLRQDREKISSDRVVEELMNCFRENRYEFFFSDTMAKHQVPIWRREKAIANVIADMRTCRVILTDRLHAMVYSVIAGVKCIALDNKTNKVFGVYDKWLRDDPNILFMRKEEGSIARFADFLSEEPKPFSAARLTAEFKKLARFIEE